MADADPICSFCPFAPGRELDDVPNVVEYTQWDERSAISDPFPLCRGRERACGRPDRSLPRTHPAKIVRPSEDAPMPSAFRKDTRNLPLMQRPPRLKPVPKRSENPDAAELHTIMQKVAPKADVGALAGMGLMPEIAIPDDAVSRDAPCAVCPRRPLPTVSYCQENPEELCAAWVKRSGWKPGSHQAKAVTSASATSSPRTKAEAPSPTAAVEPPKPELPKPGRPKTGQVSLFGEDE